MRNNRGIDLAVSVDDEKFSKLFLLITIRFVYIL